MSARYRTIVADPPWQYRNTLEMSDGVARSAMSQYRTLSLAEIQGFLRATPTSTVRCETDDRAIPGTIADSLAPDAHLWLWTTGPFLLDGSAASVARMWGFEPKAIVVWVKGRLDLKSVRMPEEAFVAALPRLVLNLGMGRYVRSCTEFLLFATRGRGYAMVQDKGVPNVIVAPRTQHSAKPDAAFDLIRRVSPGPRLSLFERGLRAGFDVHGDELPTEETHADEICPDVRPVV